MHNYFTDRENGPVARTVQSINPRVWAGLAAVITSLETSAAFGYRFPKNCPDGQVVCGVDEEALAANVQAEMPGLAWPLETSRVTEQAYFPPAEYAPPTLLILDLLEYVHARIAKPIAREYHKYYSHTHIVFDVEAGQLEFRDDVNRVFARNGVAYELCSNGQVIRLLPPFSANQSLRPCSEQAIRSWTTCWRKAEENSFPRIHSFAEKRWSGFGIAGSDSNQLRPTTRSNRLRNCSIMHQRSRPSVTSWKSRPKL